ncbi:MAG: DUF11 domain-containing protein [Oscillospiraceae bacterium]|nr:DUF11 domain-containing protein [Oscillospiraceae bacterium]
MATFTNQATLAYNGITVNSNTVTGNLVEVLAVTKTAVGNEYSANDTVTYIVSITNSGTAPFTGVTVTDNLGAYSFDTTTLTPLDYVADSAVYYQNGILQPSPTVTSVNPLTFTGITVPAGGNAIIVYETRTNEFAPLPALSTITNVASVTAAGITTPLTDTETVTVIDEPVLSITKALNPVNVTENSELTYTFTIQNTGNSPAVATDNLVITDTFDPILTGIVVTVDGVTLPAESYTYNEATGEFATVPGAITVPAATFTQDPVTGNWITTPGVTTVTVTGTV